MHLILRKELSSAALKPVTWLRIEISKTCLLVPTTDLAHLQRQVSRLAIIQRKANLVDVVLAGEHLKKSVVGFGSISIVEPTKPVKWDVGTGVISFDF